MINTLLFAMFFVGFFGALEAQSCVHLEQSSLNFFLNDILPDQTSLEVDKVSFTFQTEAEYSRFDRMPDCFAENSSVRIGLYKSIKNAVKSKPKPLFFANKLKTRKSSKWNLRVYIANEYDSAHYVRIDLIKGKSFMNTYFIKMNEHGCVQDWCLTGKIW